MENAMNRSARVLLVVTSIMGLAAWAQAAPFFGKKPAKNYELTDSNGPWMIMACSFSGENARQEAHQLAIELRAR